MIDHVYFFFFNDTATTEIYPLSLHDALPISAPPRRTRGRRGRTGEADPDGACRPGSRRGRRATAPRRRRRRSEEHTSELQSRQYLVCRLLLEKKKNNTDNKY